MCNLARRSYLTEFQIEWKLRAAFVELISIRRLKTYLLCDTVMNGLANITSKKTWIAKK